MSSLASCRLAVAAMSIASTASPGCTRAVRSPAPSETTRAVVEQPPPTHAWPIDRAWTPALEDSYGELVRRLGRAVAAHQCRGLAECLTDPVINPLHDPADEGLVGDADCADLPYTLRAYFAYHRRLPFAFVAEIAPAPRGPTDDTPSRSADPDRRYLAAGLPGRSLGVRDFPSPQSLFDELPNLVHSGMFRVSPDVEDGDFYPIAIRRGALKPGAVFYDPGGHVLVVADVHDDGNVDFIDGHTDGSLSWTRLDETFDPGERSLGGGFLRFRPISVAPADGSTVRAANRTLVDHDGASQWEPSAWRAGGRPSTYAEWVRSSLARPGTVRDRVGDVALELDQLCRAVADRRAAVELATARALPGQQHPLELPANIYGANGEWETYATAARDVRLRALALAVRRSVAAATVEERGRLRAAFQSAVDRPECRARYRASDGTEVTLTLPTVLDRIWDLSFDPYHCAERRWGAPIGSLEASACRDGDAQGRWYQRERRLRLRLARTSTAATPIDAGPTAPSDVDPRPLLR